MTIRCQKLGEQDVPLLTEQIRLYAEVFETENFALPNRDYLAGLLQKEQLLFLVALADNKVVGGLTAHLLPSVYVAANELYIYDLAVATAYQRRGIGRQLLAELKRYGQENGEKEIFVQADLEDQHAIAFYRATGGQPERVVHFSYPQSG